MKTDPQGARWRKLDNTGKLFPVIANEELSNVFRISVTLKEEVDPVCLQQALEEVLPNFDAFQVKLKRGFFWYYFETNKRQPFVEKERLYPCKYIDPKSNQLFLFRVTYYQCRINLEVFHALTDGMGGAEFLKALTCCYLQKKKDLPLIVIDSDRSVAEVMNVEDSYLSNYKKTNKKRYSSKPAYRLTGEYLPLDQENVIQGTISLSLLKQLSKQYQVTITQFLAAAYIWALYQAYIDGGQMERSMGLNIPINLRSFFQSSTMANFFAVFVLYYQSDDASFEDILANVCKQMRENITKKKLEEIISYNVSQEKKWYLRIVPLVIKRAALNIIFRRNDRAYSTTLSNVGMVKVADEFNAHIEDFNLMIGVSKRQPMKCAVCTYMDKVMVTFSSVFKDSKVQDYFFNWMKEQGVLLKLESNGLTESDIPVGQYPRIPYNVKRWKNLLNIFYGVLLSVSAILGVVHYTSYRSHIWLIIVSICMVYVVLTVRYSIMRHANLASKIVLQTLVADLLLIAVDWAIGFSGWSVDYGIPSLILFSDIAIVFLIIVNRLNWQSYFMYQIAVTIFSFIPMVLWAFKLITHPTLAIVTMIISVLILTLTMLLGDRSVKHELIRRFHL